MSRFCGMVGFRATAETAPGVYEPVITEKRYKGDVLVNTWRHASTAEKVNSDVTIQNRIRIIANPYAYRHMSEIAYVEWFGVKWAITSIEVEPPTLTLTLGGVYGENETGSE